MFKSARSRASQSGSNSAAPSATAAGDVRSQQSPSAPEVRSAPAVCAPNDVKVMKKVKWLGDELKGHNDTVFSVDSDGLFAITGG